MNLSELEHGTITPLRATLSAAREQPSAAVGVPLRLQRPSPASPPLLVAGSSHWALRGATPGDERRLDALLDRGLPRIVHVTRVHGGGEAFVHVHEFRHEVVSPEPLELGVDERLLEKLRESRRLGPRGDLPTALAKLAHWFLLPDADDDGRQVAFITLGTASGAGADAGFWLHGRRVSASVRRVDGRLLVRQVTPLRRVADRRDDPMRLLRGALRFVDATLASELRPIAATELDAIVSGSGSYLARWHEVNEIEHRILTRRARAIGTFRYERCTYTASGRWRFHLGDAASELQARLGKGSRDELAASPRPPADEPAEAPADGGRRARPAPRFTGEVARIDPAAGWVELRHPQGRRGKNPPATGYLHVSEVGDEARIERRVRAREAIRSASCPMPRLGLMLEGRPAPYDRGRKLAAIPPSVLRCFRDEPTAMQKEALLVAVNTPDIALIQGPPGTGKTEVIAALERWLAELKGTRGGLAKSVLLTSFQHDAVDNAAGRSRVLDMPALRVGGRRGDADDGLPPDALAWGRGLAAELRAELATRADGPLLQAARELQRLVRTYALAPTAPTQTAQLLLRVAELGEALLSGGLRERLRERAAALARPADVVSFDELELRALRACVRALRTTAAAFADDGARNARRLLSRLREQADAPPEDCALLARAGAAEQPDDDLLDALAALRDRMLTELHADDGPVGAATHDEAARRLLTEAADEAGERVRASRDAVSQVLARLVDDLEHDPRAVVDAVGHYTAVVAATCQQSASAAMASAAGVEFDTVIVDEAARANPLDLMIPLAQARRRIVLVGDHRQLPHVLEPEVERELSGDVADATRRALRQSLFERLFEQLRAQQQAGGVARVVTLDQQFRMHPRLGRFLSEAFYEPHGTRLRSPRPASDFAIELPGLPRAPAAWVDVPRNGERDADEQRVGSSRARPAEATWIAERLPGLMAAEPHRTFGVISFYSSQVRAIEAALERRELLVRDDEDELALAPAWRAAADGSNGLRETRLRVGTVDRFQGLEFDVVLLSLTRTSAPGRSLDARTLRSRYGHLLLANRLCVAMSRQRRMLIVVGDRTMASGPQAAAAVPQLVMFRELCEEVRDGEAALAVPA